MMMTMTTTRTIQMMDPSEARRRFEKMLVDSGYSMTGKWTDKYHEQTEKENVFSMAIKQFSDVRAVLWIEKGDWQGMISVAVGESGEFPLTGGRLIRRETQLWSLQPYHLLASRIEEVLQQVFRWHSEKSGRGGDQAMMRLTLDYIRGGKPKKAISVLLGALRGEISEATIAESLSIIQTRWSKSREERLRSALIWSQTFK